MGLEFNQFIIATERRWTNATILSNEAKCLAYHYYDRFTLLSVMLSSNKENSVYKYFIKNYSLVDYKQVLWVWKYHMV